MVRTESPQSNLRQQPIFCTYTHRTPHPRFLVLVLDNPAKTNIGKQLPVRCRDPRQPSMRPEGEKASEIQDIVDQQTDSLWNMERACRMTQGTQNSDCTRSNRINFSPSPCPDSKSNNPSKVLSADPLSIPLHAFVCPLTL